MKDLFAIYKLYLYALKEREEHGEKYGDTDEIIEMYEKQLKDEKVLHKSKTRVNRHTGGDKK